MNSNQNNNEQSKEQQEQHNVDSNQRLAQTAVKGGATAAGAALGGAVGAKIGSKVGDIVNNSKVGQGLTRGVGNAMNTMNKFNPAGKITQNATNKLADSGAMDLADKGIDAAANAGSGTPSISSQGSAQNLSAPAATQHSASPISRNQISSNGNNNISQQQPKASDQKSNPQSNNINKESYNPWSNSKNPSKNRLTRIQNNTNFGEENTSEEQSSDTIDDVNSPENESNETQTQNVEKEKKIKEFKQKILVMKIVKAAIGLAPLLLPIFFVIIIIFIVAGVTGSFTGENANGDNCINTPVCKTVIIKDGTSAGTYTLDEYLTGAVKHYFKDYNDTAVFSAMGIVVQVDLVRNSDYNTKDESCTLTSSANYPELDLIDMSNPSDYTDDDEASKNFTDDDKLNHKIITAVSNTKSQTLTYYNNPKLDEVNMDALNPGVFDTQEKIIQNYLNQTDDLQSKIIDICSTDKDLVVNYCSKVSIINGEDAGEYDFEDYIAGVVNAEVGILRNEEVYKAFAVAARNYLLTHSTENNGVCSIEDSSYFQTFTPTNNQKVIDAVNATKGEFLYNDGKLVSTQYDAFCWYEKDDNYYTLRQKNQKIPSDWVEQNVDIAYRSYKCATGSNHGHGNGMSQYGSKYLATIKNFNYEQILTYYYRGNISSGASGNPSSSGNSTPEIISGVTANVEGYVMPLQNYGHVSCEFGNGHRGIDVTAAAGTPIMSVHGGKIMEQQYHYSWGYYILIQNTDNTKTRYAHMSRFKEGLNEGSEVKAGQVIGYVGSTGNSTGNHLHLEMYNTSGQLVNPRSYFAF